ncbi:MAG: hypothetical protein GWP19_03220 [Planctomycetia bacterium]|nr:hypothetical protein [Planctomycetia bacterium]
MKLIKWDEIIYQIATSTDIKELSVLRNQLTAYKELAKQSKQSLETQNKIAEYRLRVDRKLGEWSSGLESTPGNRTDLTYGNVATGSKPKKEYFKEINISEREMCRKESIASIPEEIFEDHILNTKNKKQELTSKSIQKVAKKINLENIKKDIKKQSVGYFNKPIIQKADCFDWLKKQEPCDLLLTDPPYMTDVVDIYSFAFWLPLALSKVKPTGRAYVFIGAYPDELEAYLNAREDTDKILSNILVWTYRNTLGPAPKYDYKLNWQAILYFRGKEAPPLDCPIMTEQFSVQDINAPDGRLGNRYHTWQKPNEIAERLIRHSTKKDDLVYDCFAGTGTFLLSANRLGRIGIGCELENDMLKIAEDRGCEIVG